MSLTFASAAPSLALLQLGLGSLLSDPLGQALAAIVAIGVVILVGRIVLRIAWRLVTIATVVVGGLFLMSVLGMSPI